MHTYVYDAEDRLYSIDGSTCYAYDAEGDRIARTNCNVVNSGSGMTSGIEAEFLYDPNHRLMTEIALSEQITRANIYAGGEFLAEDSPDPFLTNTVVASQLRVTDQVGSLRALMDTGNPKNLWSGAWSSFPYGDGATPGDGADSGDNPGGMLFTGQRRDAESGLDDFGARYYSSAMGRFMSPDPGGVAFSNLSNPQSWNLYSYVLNDPLTNIDPDGHDCVTDNGDGSVSTNTGDCANENENAANHEFYINCDGCSANSTGATLDATTGSLYLTDANGNGIAGTTVQGFADPAGMSAVTGSNTSTSGSTTTINLFGSNFFSTQVSTGTHPFRDNNPGDILSGRFVSGHGAIGRDGRFGVFPSAGRGKAALDALLHNPSYSNLSINEAVSRYAPALENNVAGYQQFLTNVVGVSGNAPLSSLSPGQFSALENGIASYEGFNAAGNSSVTTTAVIY